MTTSERRSAAAGSGRVQSWRVALRLSIMLAVALALATSCRDARDSAPAEPAAATPPGAIAPATLGAVVRRAHFAFRRDGEAWMGGHDAYASRVTGGALRVTPYAGHSLRGADFVAVTEDVRRGRARLAGRARAAEAGPDATVTIDRGCAVERFENTEEGVEQSWRFAEPPEGDGDLVVSIRVSGPAYTGETAAGLHFADPATGLGVRYGAATWIDARGARTPVSAAYDGAAIVLTVPGAAVSASAYPAVLDPMVSPEYGTDKPVPHPAPYDQMQPAVAYGGGYYLAVWQEHRTSGPAPDLWAARIDAATGAVLEASGIAVSTAAGTQSEPAVAFDGTSWLVVWKDTRWNASGDIYAARVSTAGAVLDPNGFAVAGISGNKGVPAVSCGGGSCLVAFASGAAPNVVVNGRLVAPNGSVLGSQFLVMDGDDEVVSTSAAWNGTDHLVVASTVYGTTPPHGRVTAARVSASGAVLDVIHPASASPTAGVPASVASDGFNWLVAFTVDDVNGNHCPRAARISKAGVNLDPANIVLLESCSLVLTGLESSIAYGGGAYAVLLLNGNLRLVAPSGAVLGPDAAYAGGSSSTMPLASNGTSYIFLRHFYSGTPGNASEIHFARFFGTASGTINLSADQLLSTAANQQRSPSVAWNGTSWLAVWEDDRPGPTTDIWGTRISPSGAVLDPAGIVISQAVADQVVPVVASNGTDWFVAWQDKRNGPGLDVILGAVVLANGAVPDTTGMYVGAGTGAYTAPSIASNGSDYLVVWDQSGSLVGARLNAAGTVLLPLTIGVISGATGASIAWNGTSYLVAGHTYPSSNWDVVAARVSPAGAVLDTTPITVAGTNASEMHPSVTSDGAGWLVAWEASSKVRAARVSAAGAVLDNPSLALSAASGAQASPKVAWDGTQYWAAFTADGAGQNDLFALRLGATGAVKDATPITVSSTPHAEARPSLASGPAKTLMISYDRPDPTGTVRVYNRVLSDFAAAGGACALAAECASGFCVDGVCCDAPCTALCFACTAAKKGAGVDGQCNVIMAGANPDGECGQQLASTCGLAGACDGMGACQLYPAGTGCGASCSGDVLQAKTCDGAGTCAAAGTTSCAPYTCAGGACKTSCTSNADCAAGRVCDGGACVSPGANGVTCAASAACQSGFCADGVCCDAACTGKCEACSAAKKGQGSDGACEPVEAGTDPDDECALQAASTCGQDGFCDGAGACARHAAGTVCAPAGCTSGTETLASLCDGAGTCVAGAATSCVPGYACVDGACATLCTDDASCAPGYTCDTTLGGCVEAPDAGTGGGGAGTGGTGSGTGGTASGTGGMGSGSGGTTETTTVTGTASGTTSSSQGGGEGGSGGADTSGGCNCRLGGAQAPGSGLGAGAAMTLAALAGFGRARSRRRRHPSDE